MFKATNFIFSASFAALVASPALAEETAVKKQIDALEGWVSILEVGSQNLDSHVIILQERVDSLEPRMDDLEPRVGLLEVGS